MSERQYLFGPFLLDPARATLEREGVPVRLRGKPLALLELLCEARGAIVTREALMRGVWPGTAIAEDTLFDAVRSLRRGLGERPGRPDGYIETVRGRGYRMREPVRVQEASRAGARVLRVAIPDGEGPEAAVRAAIAPVVARVAGHGSDAAKQAYEEAIESARAHGEAAEICAALWGRTIGALITGRYTEAEAFGRVLLEEAEASGQLPMRLMALDALTARGFFAGDLDPCRQHGEALLEAYSFEAHHGLLDAERIDLGVNAAGYLALIEAIEAPAKGDQGFRSALDRLRACAAPLRQPGPLTQFHALMSVANLVHGDLAVARREAALALEQAANREVAPWDRMARALWAAAGVGEGEPISSLEDALESWRDRLMGRCLILLLSADAADRGGHREQAIEWSAVALADARVGGEGVAIPGLVTLRSRLGVEASGEDVEAARADGLGAHARHRFARAR